MQSEDFDKKIREAADQHHPAYNDKAWARMEKLLDKHLPQKKDDRRRIIFLLLLFLLLGGGTFLIINKPWQTKSLVLNRQNQSQPILHREKAALTVIPDMQERKRTEIDDHKIMTLPAIVKLNPVRDNKYVYTRKEPATRTEQGIINKDGGEKKPISGEPLAKKSDNTPLLADNSGIGKDIPVLTSPAKSAVIAETHPDEKDKNDKIDSPISTASGNVKVFKKKNSFFIALSGGPDVSVIGISYAGRLKFAGGAGIGFNFRDKFTLRTGFYTARKIYSSSPDEYHPPSYFWTYYPKLQKVSADCKVYEIPILVTYNFGSSARQGWSATAGLSSYLMKRETYDYLYKNASGQLANRKYTIKDKNQHYFSVLTLSGGYRWNLTGTFALMAEPYVKVPLSGIGYGRVNLNSAGILFSTSIKLFGSSDRNNKTLH